MSASIANFASCLGKYDATLSGSAVIDVSGMIGNSDLSMNAGYLTNTTGFVMPSAIDGNGISFSGWFNPNGAEASNYTPIFDISCSATQSITLCVSGNSLTPALVGNYNGNQVYQATGITANAWNFFTYTICCSGASQQLVQNLYVNNNTVSVTGGTYTALTFANSNVGYGTGIFANYFNGKIDDFRYYGRVITPMEVRVLNSYAYGKSTVSTLVPSLGTITYTAGLPTSVPFVFSNTGTYSYLQYKRIGNNGTAYMGTLSPSAMVPSGQTYTWTDTTVVPAVTYLYTWTPYILGTPGLSSSVQSIYTLAPATAFTGFTPSAFTPTGGVGGWTGFTLTWTGGVGTSINYLYYINNTPITANYTGSGASQTLTFTGLTAPTSGTTPTAYAWYVDICANNLAGTTHGTYTLNAPPTALVLTSAYSSGNVTLSWTGGAGNAVSYYYYIMSGTGTQSTGQTITSPYNVPVTGQGPWTIDVSATNITGTVGALTTAQASPFTISSITTSNGSYTTDQKSSLSGSLSTGNGIVGGTSTTNGITYQCYAFGQISTWGTYSISHTGGGSYMYVLAVGGGGGAGGSGGGGGGGVVMMPVNLPTGSGTITVNVGAGGSSSNPGSNTTVGFSVSPALNISATGGGTGQDSSISIGGGGIGGSAGGAGNSVSASILPNNNNYNYGNSGGYSTTGSAGGGGGAGTAGPPTSGVGGNGGNGIQCFLPGINNFAPSGTPYGTYYWGGGAGGGSSVSGGKGGLGGGGGGGSSGGIAGGGGISMGGNGTSVGANFGGANTGGGGGGWWGGSTFGAGGSGIVVIAFPQTTILTNQSAVLPSTLVSSGAYNAVLSTLATSSPSAYNSIKGAFACKLLNYNYFGPIMTLRHSQDANGLYTTNFYADVCGNVGTGYLGTGQSVSDWLSVNGANTTYAYVTKWYDQGMDNSFNSATQYTLASQPIYDVANGLINYGYTSSVVAPSSWTSNAGNAYLLLPNGTFPYCPVTNYDTSYTFIHRHGQAILNGTNSAPCIVYAGGSTATSGACGLMFNNGNGSITAWWNSNDYSTYVQGTTNQVITNQYLSTGLASTGGTRSIFMNSPATTTPYIAPQSGVRANPSTGNAIGNSVVLPTWYGNFQLYNLFIFSTAIDSATNHSDRLLLEATPYTYATPGTIAGLSVTNLISTSFTLSWTSFSATATYALWINGSFVMTIVAGTGTLTTGTVTPTMKGPWNLNLYAYGPSPGYALVASGSLITPIFLLDFTSATAPTADSIGTYPVTVVGTVGITNDAQAGYVMTGGTQFYNVPGLITSGPYTISLWFKSTSVNGNYDPFSSALGATYFNIANSSGNPMYLKFVTANATIQTSSIMNANTWYFLTVTFTGLTITLYINGTSSASQTNLNYNYLTSAVNIGAYSTNNTTGDYGTGCYIYGYRQYNCALSSAQIVQLMAMTKRSGIP